MTDIDMSLAGTIADVISTDPDEFRTRVPERLPNRYHPDRLDGPIDAAPLPPASALEGMGGSLEDRERTLVWELWTLNPGVGMTITRPAYQDTPILYVNQRFREITGYSMAELRGQNPRVLQGPDTDSAAIAALREAVSIWEGVTVTLRNYRRDGTPFENQVTLVPIADETGTIGNWLGIQEPTTDR